MSSIAVAVACGAVIASAQTSDVFVAADDGTVLHPIARYDGREWAATCDISPFGKLGERSARTTVPRIVATGGVRVDPVRHVKPDTPEWTGLEPAIRRLFLQREREEDVSAAALAGVPMVIDTLSATLQESDGQVHFFTASKSIPDSRGDVDLDEDGEIDPPGTLRVDVSGWIRGGTGSPRSIGTNATLSWEQDDDRPDGSRRSQLRAMAVLGVADRTVWVLQGRAAALTWFTLYDVGVSGIRQLVRSTRC